MNYIIYTMIVHLLQKNLKLLMICCQKIADKYSIKVGGVRQLVPSLSKKNNYAVHYINLELFLSLEMKLNKILNLGNLIG